MNNGKTSEKKEINDEELEVVAGGLSSPCEVCGGRANVVFLNQPLCLSCYANHPGRQAE